MMQFVVVLISYSYKIKENQVLKVELYAVIAKGD